MHHGTPCEELSLVVVHLRGISLHTAVLYAFQSVVGVGKGSIESIVRIFGRIVCGMVGILAYQLCLSVAADIDEVVAPDTAIQS